jgi:D-xylose transport system permease protein
MVFSVLRPETFTNSFNFANLLVQSAPVIVIAMGLVFVLLIGEIDLSAGFTAGVSGAMLGVISTRHGYPWWAGVLVCLATGAFIGLVIGVLVARVGIPSFVVTLAAFLGLQGLLLQIIGEGGTIRIQSETVLAIMSKNLPVWLGWTLYVALVVAYAAVTFQRMVTRRTRGLVAQASSVWLAKVLGLAALLGVCTYYLSVERSRNASISSIKGVPIVIPVVLVLLVLFTALLTRTLFGRHVYAVGGNAEAARRAGINVPRVRLICFVLCSTIAAIAGTLLASRVNSVTPSTGGGETLLYAVGAAVIGGTSLFGGKGRPVDAIIGGLVVAVVANGMGLLNQPAAVVYMVTGLVLLLAAGVDALSRRRAASTGRV